MRLFGSEKLKNGCLQGDVRENDDEGDVDEILVVA